MKTFLALFLAFVVAISVTAFAANDIVTQTAQTNNSLVALLPASDAVITLNMKRLLNDGLPQILVAKPDKLAQLNAQMDEIKAKTGIDPRSFEQIVVGASLRQ